MKSLVLNKRKMGWRAIFFIFDITNFITKRNCLCITFFLQAIPAYNIYQGYAIGIPLVLLSIEFTMHYTNYGKKNSHNYSKLNMKHASLLNHYIILYQFAYTLIPI